ncbi:MAG: hypothetical protein FWD50_06920, partial [Betaproteobacteria bacterium]|nr:hypothetical protein [Betaproteobacteria bacterium]
ENGVTLAQKMTIDRTNRTKATCHRHSKTEFNENVGLFELHGSGRSPGERLENLRKHPSTHPIHRRLALDC